MPSNEINCRHETLIHHAIVTQLFEIEPTARGSAHQESTQLESGRLAAGQTPEHVELVSRTADAFDYRAAPDTLGAQSAPGIRAEVIAREVRLQRA